jgi:hypothetical protein
MNGCVWLGSDHLSVRRTDLASAQALDLGKTKPRLGRQAGVLRQSSKLSHKINALLELAWQAQTGGDMPLHKLRP